MSQRAVMCVSVRMVVGDRGPLQQWGNIITYPEVPLTFLYEQCIHSVMILRETMVV